MTSLWGHILHCQQTGREVPTLHVYWADKRTINTQRMVARQLSDAMAEIDGVMITGPQDVTLWFHRVATADIYVNGVSLGPSSDTNEVTSAESANAP